MSDRRRGRRSSLPSRSACRACPRFVDRRRPAAVTVSPRQLLVIIGALVAAFVILFFGVLENAIDDAWLPSTRRNQSHRRDASLLRFLDSQVARAVHVDLVASLGHPAQRAENVAADRVEVFAAEIHAEALIYLVDAGAAIDEHVTFRRGREIGFGD